MVDQAAKAKLQKHVKGEILLPTDAAYDEARRIFNAVINRRPAVIVRCTQTPDVVAAVQLAREHGLPLSIRGGGHSVSGNAVCDGGVMLDMSRWKEIHVDRQDRTAKAAPGLTLGDFDRATSAHQLVTPLGVVSKTGIAGLTLGGGLGWLMGKYGLACDNLIGAEVVTADGKVVWADAKENADFFWGLRGGSGNFGVVTRFEYRLHPVPPIIGGLLIHPVERTKELLRFYREFTRKCPDELTVYVALLRSPEGNPVCGYALAYSGDPAAAERVLAPLRAFGPPVADMVSPMPYIQLQSMLDESYPGGRFHYWKSGFMNAIPDEAVDVIVDWFGRRVSSFTEILFEHMHGAPSRVPTGATAFSHRFDHYNFSGFSIWLDGKDTERNLKWSRELWQAMRPFLSGRAYVNYLSQEGVERVREAYGTNYDRLVALKNKYDPTNFFRLNQNILPTAGN
jgi:hypothetical protein